MTVEEKIEHYSALSAEERRDLEQYVSEHPSYAPALADAKRWDAFLRDAAALGTRPPSDEALAWYAVMRQVDEDKMPQDRAEAFARIEEAVGRSGELQRRFEAYERRREELEQSSDAAAQYRRLTSETAAAPADHGAASAGPSRRTLLLRRTVAAAIAAAAVYGVLLLASQLTRPLHERLASFDASQLSVEGFRDTRASDAEGRASDATTAYLAALNQLRGAESSFLGLFPAFDETRIDSAAILLRRVIELEPEDSFLANEARFLLGKTVLAEGDVEDARRHLQHVVASSGRLQSEAAALLTQLPASP